MVKANKTKMIFTLSVKLNLIVFRPHITRNNSLILVDSKGWGKTMAYVPAICSLIQVGDLIVHRTYYSVFLNADLVTKNLLEKNGDTANFKYGSNCCYCCTYNAVSLSYCLPLPLFYEPA